METTELNTPDDVTLADRMKQGRDQIIGELKKLIIGQDEVVNQVLLTLFVGGNSLIVGVPGLAKTLLIHTMARVLDLRFNRVQFTPDLMPSDITGTDIIQEDPSTGRRSMVFAPGPIFANIVLADEINRTPPKTQSALLEAMQEHRVTIQGRTYKLEEPFYVFATQNPIELEGTYPLPEAQLDRFLFNVVMTYLSEDDEVIRTTTAILEPQFERPVTGADRWRSSASCAGCPWPIRCCAMRCRSCAPAAPSRRRVPTTSRSGWPSAAACAPRNLVLAGKARALTSGRFHVSFEDIRALAHPVLRHRVLTNFHAQSEGISSDMLVDRLLEAVPVPRSGM
ncbi:MAG: AAA family ATPase [Vicinamibacterales bacterium]